MYEAACAACHGSDGRGTPALASEYPRVPPDFSDCSFATREPAADWVAVSHAGGPARAFSRLMPAFSEALSRGDLELAVSHARSFCSNDAWPRGELNLPRALVTTKAFPEDEAVLTVIADGGTVTNKFVYEQRIGPRNQYEVIVPLAFSERAPGDWTGGGRSGVRVQTCGRPQSEARQHLQCGRRAGRPDWQHRAEHRRGNDGRGAFVAFGQRCRGASFFQAQVGGSVPF
jgi:hypothetical protein